MTLAIAPVAATQAAQVYAPPKRVSRPAQVLRVGSFHGIPGQFRTIQAAVDAAKPGDWILVGPGDYHEVADMRGNRGPQPTQDPAGVIIAKAHTHLRGMDRNAVVVDGTRSGSRRCSSAQADQNLGPLNSGGHPLGREGILVWEADGVSVENLTVCNFVNGAGDTGNEIWWNGGSGTNENHLHGFAGNYLSTTSTYFSAASSSGNYQYPQVAGQYGVFSSDASGGEWDHIYGSNMADSAFYIGACDQYCNQTMSHAHGEYSSIGYSGTNSGGNIVVSNSEFDQNRDGFDTNSQNNSDAISPQDGSCPNGGISPITHTHSCWVFMNNYVHDNNNPNVPGSGVAGEAPVGTGLSISGGRNDTVMNNRFVNNGAWGVVFIPYPDSETPRPPEHCQGGDLNTPPTCIFDDFNNALIGNQFQHNGFYGNPSNGDFGEITLFSRPSNCFSGNTEVGGGNVTSSPSGLQQSKPTCGATVAQDPNTVMTNEVLCDTQFVTTVGSNTCPLGSKYPRTTTVVTHPLLPQTTMPNVCGSVPADPWCSGGTERVAACSSGHTLQAALAVSQGERLLGATVRIAGDAAHTFAGGSVHNALVTLALSARDQRLRNLVVSFQERLRIGSGNENVRFTRIYHRCGR